MIFVTVGTHEQQFNRLVEAMDTWAANQSEEIIIQTGYCTYVPQHCTWQQWFSYDEMAELIKKADIVITHGGPSSFMAVLQEGKVPIVVPRQSQYDEHVNDHQLLFCRSVAERMGSIVLIENIDTIGNVLNNYINNAGRGFYDSNNETFCVKLNEMVANMFGI